MFVKRICYAVSAETTEIENQMKSVMVENAAPTLSFLYGLTFWEMDVFALWLTVS